MTRPVVPAVTEYWNDELGVTQPGDESRGWPFLTLLGALGVAFGPLHDIARNPDVLLDPTLAPDPTWLAQFDGVDVAGLTDAEARARITSPPAFERGTGQAMASAGRLALTGLKRVRVLERNGGTPAAYHVTFVTRTDETPDPAAFYARVTARDVAPAGIVVHHVVSNDPLWDEATKTWDQAAGTVTWDNAALGDV